MLQRMWRRVTSHRAIHRWHRLREGGAPAAGSSPATSYPGIDANLPTATGGNAAGSSYMHK